MKYNGLALLICILSMILLFGCTDGDNIESTYCEAFIETDEQLEPIGNNIPDWVMETVNSEPLYVVTESLQEFDNYAYLEFPSLCDAYWTQSQSDAVYLGKGIRNFQLDDEPLDIIIVDYPVILNGYVVSILKVYKVADSDELSWQMEPISVDEMNSFIGKTDENSPILIGFNHNNKIALQGERYYILDVDHVKNEPVDSSVIPVINNSDYTVVNVLEPLCTERTADVSDWAVVPIGD